MNQGYGAYVAIKSKITGHWQHCHKQFHMAMDRDLTQFFNWLDQSNAIERRHRCRCRSTKSELAIERETSPVKKCVAIGSSTNQMTVDILYIMSYFGCHDERLK